MSCWSFINPGSQSFLDNAVFDAGLLRDFVEFVGDLGGNSRGLFAVDVLPCGDGLLDGVGEFLTPVRHVAAGSVGVDHAQGRVTDVSQLVPPRRDVNHLPGGKRLAFRAEAHLAGAFDDEVGFFLLLVMPRNLSAVRVERDVAESEVLGLERLWAVADKALGVTARRVAFAFDGLEVSDGHRGS